MTDTPQGEGPGAGRHVDALMPDEMARAAHDVSTLKLLSNWAWPASAM